MKRLLTASGIVLAILLGLASATSAALINVRDFASVQDALDATQPGDRLYFPTLGTAAYFAPAGGWIIDKSLEIFGDAPGPEGDDTGTSIRPFSNYDHVFILQPPIDNIYIHDLTVRNTTTPSATYYGRAVSCSTGVGQKATRITLERVIAANMGGDAFHFAAADPGASAIIWVTLRDCFGNLSGGAGLYLKHCVLSSVTGGGFNGNNRAGARVEASGGTDFINVGFEGNRKLLYRNHVAPDTCVVPFDPDTCLSHLYQAQLRLKGAHHTNVIGCHFENFDATIVGQDTLFRRTAIAAEYCLGGVIEGTTLGNDEPATPGLPSSLGIWVTAESRAIQIGSNSWSYVDTLISIHPGGGSTNCVVFPQAMQHYSMDTPGVIVMPDEDGNGNFAFLAVQDSLNTGAGLLLPRLTQTMRDSVSAQAGLTTYNSTQHNLNFYDGSEWVAPRLSGAALVSPTDMVQTGGSTAAPTTVGTYPNKFVYLPFLPSPASKPQGWGFVWRVPDDWISGQDIGVNVLLHAVLGGPLDDKTAVMRFDYLAGTTFTITAGGTTVEKIITLNMAGGGGDFDAYNVVKVINLGAIDGGSLNPGDIVRLNLDRDVDDASDDFGGTLGLSGIQLVYR